MSRRISDPGLRQSTGELTGCEVPTRCRRPKEDRGKSVSGRKERDADEEMLTTEKARR